MNKERWERKWSLLSPARTAGERAKSHSRSCDRHPRAYEGDIRVGCDTSPPRYHDARVDIRDVLLELALE